MRWYGIIAALCGGIATLGCNSITMFVTRAQFQGANAVGARMDAALDRWRTGMATTWAQQAPTVTATGARSNTGTQGLVEGSLAELEGLDPLTLFYTLGEPTRVMLDGTSELWQVRRGFAGGGCWVTVVLTTNAVAASPAPLTTAPKVSYTDWGFDGVLPYANMRDFC